MRTSEMLLRVLVLLCLRDLIIKTKVLKVLFVKEVFVVTLDHLFNGTDAWLYYIAIWVMEHVVILAS